MFCGLLDRVNRPLYLPPPSLLSVPMSWLVDVTNTFSTAPEPVPVASTRNSLLPLLYSARVMVTVSGGRVGLAVGVVCGGGGAAVAVRVALGVAWGGGGAAVAVRVGVAVRVAVGTAGGVGVEAPPGGCTVRRAV